MTGTAPLKILLVDDYPAARYARAKTLRQAGWDVQEAATGKEALACVAATPPDVLVLDVNLPDIDGFDIGRRVKSDPVTAAVQIVYTTASFEGADDRVRGLEIGADAYLVEPIEPQVLVATVRALARTRSAELAADAVARQWQATFDAIRDGVCLVDGRGRILRHNSVFRRLIGVPDDLVGRPLADVLVPLLGREIGLTLAGALETVRRTQAEGQAGGLWLQLTVDPMLDDGGRAEGAVCILTDVSERKRFEQARGELLVMEQRARAAAEASNQAKDEFLAVLSHELRTPLTTMLGWSRILLSGRLPAAEVPHALEAIERNTRVQMALIEDLLDVSRIITGKLRLDVEPVQVGSLVSIPVQGAQRTADERGVTLESRIEADVPVLADAARIHQVISNLLSNALKFTPAGGRVELVVSSLEQYVQIVVTDTGRGIDPAFVPYLFEPFRQADVAGQRWRGGLGLGLAIVRHIVELHGGMVHGTSEGIGRGARFTVLLPRMHSGRSEPLRVGGPQAHVSLTGLRILLVEDHDDTRDLVSAVLRQAGAAVTAVAEALQALAALDAQPFDLLISDIGLGDMNGYELMRTVRERPPSRGGDVRAIALTAYARGDDEHAALSAGFDRHVPKPVDPALLARVVATVSRGR